MISDPQVHLTVKVATDWSAEGRCSERALAYSKTLAAILGLGPFAIEVLSTAREHSGLGVGTQIAMGVAAGLVASLPREMPRPSLVELGSKLERGNRSAIGIHGGINGGFLMDGGRSEKTAPLIARIPWPERWAVILVIPPGLAGRYGQEEIETFARLADLSQNESRSDRLCGLVVRDILPALAERNLPEFGCALHEFNRLVGESFAPVQGGVYGDRQLFEIVRFLQASGGTGSGQSSWGPAVFTFAEGTEKAHLLAEQVRSKFSLDEREVVVTSGLNRGIAVSVDGAG
jgi:beta-RFAP synthase